MAFKYLGAWKELAREVEKHKDAINARYREVLGEDNYKKLDEASKRLLTPKSFFDNAEKWEARFKQTLPENAPNNMTLAGTGGTILEIGDDGSLVDKKIRTAVTFYISEEGFRNSGSAQFTDKPIASYVHEFDHFATYVLQKVPLYLANMALFGKAKPSNTSAGLVAFLEELKEEPETLKRKQRAILGLQAFTLQDMYEHGNKILDKQILDAIGIPVDLPWRGRQKEFDYFPISPDLMLTFPISGDSFRKCDDREAVHAFLEWENTLQSSLHLPYYGNFLDSLADLRVSRVPIDEIHGNRKKKKKKDRRGQ